MPIRTYILALLNERLVKEKEKLKEWEDKLNDDTIGDHTDIYEPHDLQAGRIEGIKIAISYLENVYFLPKNLHAKKSPSLPGDLPSR